MKLEIRNRKSQMAFTLVELLVVITIIVILLALLAPALDKAIYEAELAVCAANEHAVSAGALTYAAQYKRRYPHRPGHISYPGNQPARLKNDDVRLAHDDRILFSLHMPLKALVCPLSGGIDLGFEANDPETQIFGAYNVWFGLQFNRVGSHGGMLKLGDRLSWGGSIYTPDTRFSNVMVSDTDKVDTANGFATTTHADREGRMTNTALQNAPSGLGGVQAKVTLSEWSLTGDFRRPPVDSNFGLDDGSVATLRNVLYD
jgi:type II secretory pathway pseudopilin PulG